MRAPRIDIDAIKTAAAGRWPEIFQRLGGLDAELLDGRHHPCPQCGGTDRFRAIDPLAGGLHCNQCFKGDGIAALRWLRGWGFAETLTELAEYLGGNFTLPGTSPKVRPKKGGNDRGITWLSPNITGLFFDDLCQAKPPITPEALTLAGARIGQWPANAIPENQHDIIALPIWHPTNTVKAVGAALVRRRGDDFPAMPKGMGKRKVHIIKGTRCGWIFSAPKPTIDAAHTLLKVEGVTDLLAISPLLPEGVAAFTSSNGARAFPPELAQLTQGKDLYIVHDADGPGEEGTAIVAKRCIDVAKSVRIINLPFEVQKDHGKDLRDWLNDATPASPRTFADLLTLAGEPETAASLSSTGSSSEIEEAPDDPHRLARICAARWDRVAFYEDEWYAGTLNTGWKVIKEGEMRARVVASIKEEFDALNRLDRAAALEAGKTPPQCRKVTSSTVANTLSALRSLSLVSGANDQSTWLADDPAADDPASPFHGIDAGPKDWIAAQNGILCMDRIFSEDPAINENCLLPHSLAWWSTVRLPYAFDPEAKCPRWLAFLQRSLEGDAERIAMLQEWAGYLLLPNTDSQKFLVLEGEGGNGKSVFLAGMQALLGSDQVSNVQLEIFGQRFALTNSLGKLANICADVGEIDRLCEGYLKAYTSGDSMFFDRKGISGINTRPTARLMISVNNRPRISDRSTGVWRRMLLCPFNIQITAAERIRGMDKFEWWLNQGEASGILNWALVGLARLREQGDFTEPAISLAAIDSYRTETNPAREFLLDHYEPGEGSKLTDDVYSSYRKWCETNGYKPLAARTFGREVHRTFLTIEHKRSRTSGDRKYSYFGLVEKTFDDDF